MKELSKNSFQQLAERYSGGGGVATLKIKDWYTKNYPTDDLGEEINGVNTFEYLWNEIHKMDINDVTDIYDVIGVIDSLVRERLFEHLSKIKGVEYRYIYDKWLESDSMETGGAVDSSVGVGAVNSKWQIKNSADKYYSLNMQSGKPVWNESPDLGYSFAKDEAEIIKNKLGDNDLQVVKYDPNWWKMSDGGEVSLWKIGVGKAEKIKTGSSRAIKGFLTKNKSEYSGKGFGIQSWPSDTTEEEVSRYNNRSQGSATSQEYAPGGKVTTRGEVGEVEFIEYKDEEIMYEPNMNKYYTNDEEFDTLKEAQNYIDGGSTMSAKTLNAYRQGAFKNGGAIAIVGKRIKLIRMTDPYPVEPGTMGTITSIDGIGQIQVNWDNGRTLAVIPGEDEYEILEDAKHYEGGDIEAYENYIVELKKGSETRRLGILAHNQQEAVSKAKKMTGKGYSIVAIRFAEGGKLIQSARITELPTEPFDGMPMPKVFVTVDGKEEYLFEYYPDELTFSEKEFVGLTTDQARTLKFEKDKKFLQGDSYAGGGKPKKTKIYAVLRTSMGVLEDIEVSNTNVDEAMAKFQAIGINIPSGARITFQSQPYYYAEGGGLGESIHLYNNQPGHDKEYHMTIIKTGMNFTVVSKWGRRGSNLRETVKTVFNIEDAQKIFNKLKREKLAEGYIEKSGGESVPNPVPAPAPDPAPFVPVTDWGGDFVEMVNGEWVKIEKRTTPYKRSDKYSNKIYKVD